MTVNNSSAMSLAEFKTLSGVPDSILVWLLTHNKLPCQLDEHGIKVMLSPQLLKDLQKTLCLPWKELLKDDYSLFTERTARTILEELDPLLNQALDIACHRKQG